MEKPTTTGTETTAMTTRTAALAVVEPGVLFTASQSGNGIFSNGIPPYPTVGEHFSCRDLEKAYKEFAAQEKRHRELAAICALQAGIAAHVHRCLSPISASQWWESAELNFGESKSSVSTKMRLAVKMAQEKGASPEALLALAQAADLSDRTNPSLQLAFDFIGTDSLTDLYR